MNNVDSHLRGLSSPTRWWLVTSLVCVVTALATRPSLPLDETRYLAVAWEMWQRGEFLVPHLNGAPYAEKPPLLFWLFHLGWSLFGVVEWWPRLLPGIMALAGLGLTAKLGREIWPADSRSPRLAPALLAATFLWCFASTSVMFDMLVAVGALVAWIGGWRAWRGDGRGWWLVALGIAWGGLAKGPVILLAVLPPLLAAPWWGAGLGGLRPRDWYERLVLASSLGAAIVFAWAVPAGFAGGTEYLHKILVVQTKSRLFSAIAHRRAWWFYLLVLPVLLFPIALWPPVWRALAALRRGPRDAGIRFCLAATVPAFLVFSSISGKQPHYLLPLFAPLALLAARALRAPPRGRGRLDVLPPSALLMALGLALAAFSRIDSPLLAAWAEIHSPFPGIALLVVAIGLVVWSGDGCRTRPQRLAAWSLALFVTVHLELAGPVGEAYDVTPTARRLAAIERSGHPIAHVDDYHGQFHFLGRLVRPIEVIAPADAAGWLRRHPGGALVAAYRGSPPDGLPPPASAQLYRGQQLGLWLAPAAIAAEPSVPAHAPDAGGHMH